MAFDLTGPVVAVRVLAGPVANALQKDLTRRSAHPLFVVGATHALLTLACVPLVARLPVPTGVAFWGNMLVAGVLAVTGNTLLVRALERGDLSVLGPLNAYKPVISLVLGIFLLGELPTAFGVAGVGLIIAGSYLVLDREPETPRRSAFARFARDDGVRLRFAALALSATEAVFLKRALLLSSPITTFAFWCVLGLPIALLAVAVLLRGRAGREVAGARGRAGTYVSLALSTGLMQLTTLLAFGALQVGYALALFQLSALVSVFLGHRYFSERGIRRRLLGALVMVVGAVSIVTFGNRR